MNNTTINITARWSAVRYPKLLPVFFTTNKAKLPCSTTKERSRITLIILFLLKRSAAPIRNDVIKNILYISSILQASELCNIPVLENIADFVK